jgi:hypothetical protein
MPRTFVRPSRAVAIDTSFKRHLPVKMRLDPLLEAVGRESGKHLGR